MQYGENLTIEFTPGVQQISSLTFELWQMRKQVQTIISAIVTTALVALDFLSVILIVAVFVVFGSRLLFLFRCCLSCQNMFFGCWLGGLATLGCRLGRLLFFLESPSFGLG